jgi:hypothetical protein
MIAAAAESASRMQKVAESSRVVQKLRALGSPTRPKTNGSPAGVRRPSLSRRRYKDEGETQGTSNGESEKLAGGAVKIIKAIAMLGEGVAVTRPQIAMLAAVKHTTGTFKNNVSLLRVAGLIEDRANKTLVLTKEGRDYLGDGIPDAPQTTEEMVELWKKKLNNRCGEILDILVESYPDGHDRETIADTLGISHTTGTFKNYLSHLRTCGLLRDEKIDGSLVSFAHDNLFPHA